MALSACAVSQSIASYEEHPGTSLAKLASIEEVLLCFSCHN